MAPAPSPPAAVAAAAAPAATAAAAAEEEDDDEATETGVDTGADAGADGEVGEVLAAAPSGGGKAAALSVSVAMALALGSGTVGFAAAAAAAAVETTGSVLASTGEAKGTKCGAAETEEMGRGRKTGGTPGETRLTPEGPGLSVVVVDRALGTPMG